MLLKDGVKTDVLRFLTSSMALILSISLCAWILYLVGVQLPHSVVYYNEGQYWYDNYYFFLYNNNPSEIIPRFSAIFLEPGHLGMITSFLLYANSFDLKRKEVLILLVATFFTFSLAAYLLMFVSVSIILLMKSKKPVIYFALWSCFLIFSYYLFTTLNRGNNVINNLIIERLQVVDGDLAGNNRFTSSMDSYFESFIKGDKSFTGLGNKKYELLNLGPNAGYKVFIIHHGIIGTALLILFYLSLVLNYRTKLSLLLLAVYILSFLQASYALWDCEILIFITAIPLLNSYRTNRINGG